MTDQWYVILDDEIDERFRTRSEARDYAGWLRRHQAVKDRQIFHDLGKVRVMRASAWQLEQ